MRASSAKTLQRIARTLGVSALAAGALAGMQIVRASRRALILDPPTPAAMEFGDPGLPRLRLVVIGDSTSVGVGASSIEATYPALLATHLSKSFFVKLDVIGRTGARMSDAAVEFAPKAVELRPDLVLVGLGANDVTHLTPLKRFAGHLLTVIATLEAPGPEILIALGPRFDAPALPMPLRSLAKARARSINRTIRRVAASSEIDILDLPGRIGNAFALDRGLYCSDGYHPGDRGYALWAEVMKDKVMCAALRANASRRADTPDTPKGFGGFGRT